MKKELNEARAKILEHVALVNPIDDGTTATVNEAFAPLFEELASRVRKSVVLAQVGTAGYRVEKTTNFLDLRMNIIIQKSEVEKLIADGVTVHVTRNK